jgi:hypothetical protein
MNIHVSEEIKKKYPGMEFRGKPHERSGRIVIEAHMPSQDLSYWYSFEEDFFWLMSSGIPDYKLPKVK